MALTLEFPALVQRHRGPSGMKYLIRPLFTPGPQASHRRFNRALQSFIGKVRNQLNRMETDRDEINDLLWFLFNPEIRFQRMNLQLQSGQRHIAGPFAVVSFELQGSMVVCLPGVDNHFFIAKRDQDGRVRLQGQVEQVLLSLFREKRKKLGKSWDPEEHLSTPGEFVTTVEVTVSVKRSSFPFEQAPFFLFASLMGEEKEFHGDEEMEKVAQDLNLLYPHDLMRAFCVDPLVERLGRLIYQGENNPLALIGPPGVGRTTLLHEAVFRHMSHQEGLELYKIEKVWHIDPVQIISGMAIIGLWQKRLEAILGYALKRLKDHGLRRDKLFFDNPVALLRVGKSSRNSMTLADVFKPYLERRSLQVIVEATPEEWSVVQERDRGFADLFQVVRVEEVDQERAVRIVMHQRARLEQENDCTISNQALCRLFGLQRAFLGRRALPGSVVDMLKPLGARYRRQEVGVGEVMEEFSAACQLNSWILDPAVRVERGQVEAFIKEHLIGQEEAAECLVKAVHILKAALKDPERPIYAFLFIGPTGVGKTQAAKVLAKYLFRSEEHLVRFDMNEMVDSEAVSRLIGDLNSPEGLLTGKIRHRPFSVLLFDEIEKAHPSVHDLLLQVLGEGRLTDALGRTVDFTNTIIVMTSNIGAREAGKAMGFERSEERAEAIYQRCLRGAFRPEFLNRIDRIVTFRRLGLEEIQAMAKMQMEELLGRDGFIRRTTILHVSPRALEHVASKGFDGEMGGRALKRAIEQQVTVMAADRLVSLPAGAPILFEVFLQGDKLVPSITPLVEAPRVGGWSLPEVPDRGRIRGAYGGMLEVVEWVVETINGALDRAQEGGEPLEELYLMREQAGDLRQEVQEALWEMEAARTEKVPRIRERVKKDVGSWRRTDVNFRELQAKWDIKEYLHHVYSLAPQVVQRSQAHFLSTFQRLGYLHFLAKGLARGQRDRLLLFLRPLVEGRGKEAVAFLTSAYLRVLDALGAPGEALGDRVIMAEGPRLADLFQGERGVHMFYLPYGAPLPLEVEVEGLAPGMGAEEVLRAREAEAARLVEEVERGLSLPDGQAKTIIRLYCLPGHGRGDGTMTDFRSGLINRADMSLEDWLFLLYGNLPEGERLDPASAPLALSLEEG